MTKLWSLSASSFLFFSALILFSGCNSVERLLGEDDDDEVVSPAPDPQAAPPAVGRYDLYRDNGGAMNTDPESQMSVNGLTLENRPLPDAGEGEQYVRIHTDLDGGTWTMTFDQNGTGRTVNLSEFSRVIWLMRLIRPIVPEDQIAIRVEDGNGTEASIPIQSISGFNSDSFIWQQIQIPTSALNGLDLSAIREPFGLTVGTLGNDIHLDIDFDDVRWER